MPPNAAIVTVALPTTTIPSSSTTISSINPDPTSTRTITSTTTSTSTASLIKLLPDSLLLHTFGFLDVPSLVRLLQINHRWRSLVTCNSLWRPLCQAEWPALMQQLHQCLSAQPDAYRRFFVKNRLSAYEANIEAAACAFYKHEKKIAEGLYARFFQELILFVDLRHATTGKPLHSMAVPLNLSNVRKLFKREVHKSEHYTATTINETSAAHGNFFMLNTEELDISINLAEGDSVRFDLRLFNTKTKTMALLGQGLAEEDADYQGYGPSPTAAVGEEDDGNAAPRGGSHKCFFGEGAEFLCAVPLFAWLFASSSSSSSSSDDDEEGEGKGMKKLTLHALTLEVTYVDTVVDEASRPQDELLECLHQIFRKALVWV